MARIKIELPATLLASVVLQVRITDINYGNHAGNDAIVGFLHETRMNWLHDHGFTELDVAGTGLIMSDLAVEFKNEAFYGDLLDIKLYVGDLTPKSFELYYALHAQRDGIPVLVARAKTGMVCFNYNSKKTVPIPPVLLSLLQVQD